MSEGLVNEPLYDQLCIKEIYEELSDDVVDEDNVRRSYAALGSDPTYGALANSMADTLFSMKMVSPSQAEAIFGQHQEAWNQLAMRLPPPGGSSAVPSYSDEGVVSVSWHRVSSSEDWMAALQSLSAGHFLAILGEIE